MSASEIDDRPDDYNVKEDLSSPTDDRIRVAWWYGEVDEETPVRVLVEDAEGGQAVAYLTPWEGERVGRALMQAAEEAKAAMEAGKPVLPDHGRAG